MFVITGLGFVRGRRSADEKSMVRLNGFGVNVVPEFGDDRQRDDDLDDNVAVAACDVKSKIDFVLRSFFSHCLSSFRIFI